MDKGERYRTIAFFESNGRVGAGNEQGHSSIKKGQHDVEPL